MLRNLLSTAKSARPPVVLALLAVLVLPAAGGLVLAANGAKDFNIAASPSTQTVTAGATATYTVTVSRLRKFDEPVALTVSGAPAGATAGFTPSTVPGSGTSSVLRIGTAPGTSPGRYLLTITGAAGKLRRTTTAELIVAPLAQPNFTISASPSTQTILSGDRAEYDVTVTRSGGFAGPVSLSVSGTPQKSTHSFAANPLTGAADSTSSTTLTIDTDPTKSGSFTLEITGVGSPGGTSVRRTAAVVLNVTATRSFVIGGDLAGDLFPGASLPLDLTVTNPNNQDLRIARLDVAIEEGTSAPACSGTQNFAAVQIPPGAYGGLAPVPAGATRTLSQLGLAPADRPLVRMVNRDADQGACKDVSVRLAYTGRATK